MPSLSPVERARRETELARRNRGFAFAISSAGDVTSIATTRISCRSRDALRAPSAAGKRAVPSGDEAAIAAALAARNPDVLPEATALVPGTRFLGSAAEGWRMELRYGGSPSYRRASAALGGRPMSDAELARVFARLARLETVLVRRGDSCGEPCGQPPVATEVSGSRRLMVGDGRIERFIGAFRTRRGLELRHLAGFRTTTPGTQLSDGVGLVDAVTGQRIDVHPHDLFEAEP